MAATAVAVLAACTYQDPAPVTDPAEPTTPPPDERTSSGDVPPALAALVSGHDDTPLPDDALVRYQLIGLTPAIDDNHRFVLYADGRLHAAANTLDPPPEPGQRFNTPLPEEPTATLDEATVAGVEQALADSALATSPPFVGDEAVRDGSVAIVTARLDGAVHEVWYQNTATELTDLLSEVYHEHAVWPAR